MLDDGNVWFNSLAGPEAGVLDRAGVTLRVLKYEPAQGDNGKAGNGLGVGDDEAALGVDLDPNHGATRRTATTTTRPAAGTTRAIRPAARVTATASAGSGLTEPLGPDAQPARLTVLPPGLPSNRSDSQAPAEVVVGADSRPSTPSNPTLAAGPGGAVSAAAARPAAGPEARRLRPLIATFNFSPGAVAVGGAVTFTDRSTGTPAPNSLAVGLRRRHHVDRGQPDPRVPHPRHLRGHADGRQRPEHAPRACPPSIKVSDPELAGTAGRELRLRAPHAPRWARRCGSTTPPSVG